MYACNIEETYRDIWKAMLYYKAIIPKTLINSSSNQNKLSKYITILEKSEHRKPYDTRKVLKIHACMHSSGINYLRWLGFFYYISEWVFDIEVMVVKNSKWYIIHFEKSRY